MSATAIPPIDLERCLNDERDTLKKCVEILDRERQLLMDGDVDALGTVGANKSLLLESAQRYSTLRERVLVDRGLPVNSRGMKLLLGDRADLRKVWAESLDWAKQADTLNRINGNLIDVRLNHNRCAISIMHQGANAHSTYGQDGHMQRAGYGRAIGMG